MPVLKILFSSINKNMLGFLITQFASLGNNLLTTVPLNEKGTSDPIIDNQILFLGNLTQSWLNPVLPK